MYPVSLPSLAATIFIFSLMYLNLKDQLLGLPTILCFTTLVPTISPQFSFPLLTWPQETAQEVCCIIIFLNRECPVFSFAGTPSLREGFSWHILYLALAGKKVVTQGVKEKLFYP